ncbi:hypothetical protein [Lysobacter silvisoli]|uniref:Lipoprotein n=1 Tax=Lysobacter silvisoli TaxID=2293254 RepID=A0A371K6F5_9GAMM|nr:hypothetical protein [Lysobacter silvisoli]RDZ29430.1 hypothetical protein DX914_10210 [Lysobacter silvisoli]
MVLRAIHTAVLGALLLAPAAAWAAPDCTVTQAQLIAAWQSGGEGDFEQFELSRSDGRNGFDSWLHQRPELLGGSWTFDPKTCRLLIDHAATGQHWEYAVSLADAKTLLLRAPDERRSARYRKIANGR